jgi:hypothetical protein
MAQCFVQATASFFMGSRTGQNALDQVLFIIQGGAIEVDEVPISLYHEKKRQAQDDRTGQRYKKDGEAGCQ